MGFRLVVEGLNETIALGADNIENVKYMSDTPNDSNARATDLGITLEIEGKIITAVDGEEADDSLKLATWSLVSAEKADAYRNVFLEVIAADQVVRKITLPNAFVVDYSEKFGDSAGTGEFKIIVKQKKEKTEYVEIEGGYTAEQ